MFADLNCQIVLKSIGYTSKPINGVAFDHQRGVIPNVRSRVLRTSPVNQEQFEEGLYACGWLKRGPTGIIGTNLYCAKEPVTSITEDLKKGVLWSSSTSRKTGREGLLDLINERNIEVVTLGWENIDSKERMIGSLKNKPREKLTWEELLKAAKE